MASDLRSVARVMLILLGLWSCTTGEGRSQASEYSIGPQDVLRVVVWGQDALSGQFTVDADGTLNYPLLGRIQAGGLTLRTVENDLKTRLAQGYLTSPQVSVTVEMYRSKRIFVVGEVRQPGTYPLSGEMSLIEALAHAGSASPEAGQEVLIVRARAGDTVTGSAPGSQFDESAVAVRVDLRQLQEGVMSQNVKLQDGDTVFVPRAEMIYVFGQVRSPGAYALRRDTTVVQALALAGGVTEKGAPGRIRIIRLDDKGKRREIHARLDDPVKPLDTIVVPERYF